MIARFSCESTCWIGRTVLSLAFIFLDVLSLRTVLVHSKYPISVKLIRFNIKGNNWVRYVLTAQTVRTMSDVYLSPNSNLAMDRDPLVSHTLWVWHQCEWIGLLDSLYINTNGLGLLAMDEVVRSIGMGPNLIFREWSHVDHSIPTGSIPKWDPSGPHKKVSRNLHESISHQIKSQISICISK